MLLLCMPRKRHFLVYVCGESLRHLKPFFDYEVIRTCFFEFYIEKIYNVINFQQKLSRLTVPFISIHSSTNQIVAYNLMTPSPYYICKVYLTEN